MRFAANSNKRSEYAPLFVHVMQEMPHRNLLPFATNAVIIRLKECISLESIVGLECVLKPEKTVLKFRINFL